MPVIDGVMDIPAPPWCTPLEAVLWIARKQAPVASHHSMLVDDGLPLLQDVRSIPNYTQSWGKLCEATRQGKVGLRGRPAFGLKSHRWDSGDLIYDRSGELEEIPPEKLKAAGTSQISSSPLWNVERFGFLSDVVFIPGKWCPKPVWAYIDIEVNFSQLVRWFHPVEGKALRFGDEVILLEAEAPRAETSAEAPRAETSAEAPQAKSSAKAAGTRNVGRRPRIWDRDGAINGTRGPIYDGKLVRTPEAAAILGLSASTLEKLRLRGNGPKYAKLGRVCAYSLPDLEAWAAARSRNSTSEPSGES